MSTSSPFPHLIDGVQNLPNLLTTYIISVIATYLTGVWGLNITSVAVMINLYSGIVGIMPLSLKFIVDAFNGTYWNVLVSRLAFSAGFVLLTLSTPPVLSWATGTCSRDEPECIGQVQKILFIIALLLIAVAVSCHLSRGLMTYELTSLLNEMIMNSPISDSDEPLTTLPESSDGPEMNKPAGFYSQYSVVYMLVLILFVPFVSLAEIGYLNRWSLKFGFPAIFVVGLSILFIKIGSYQPQPRAQGSLRATVFRKKDSRISFLFLIPISISFILLGVVSSLGNTFFIEQAVDMNHYVGSLWFPIITLPLFQHSCKMEGPVNCSLPKLGIAVSMIFASLSCITAAKVETRRLGVVTSQGVTNEPEEIIPMTMFWLVPQFLLLGLSQAISEKCITDFFTNELVLKPNEDDEATRELNQKYMEFLAQALNGVGIIVGLLLVFIVRDVTAANGGTRWFGNTVNTSRLDNYYWILATLSAANLVLFVVVISSHHLCTKSSSVEDDQQPSSTTVPLIA